MDRGAHRHATTPYTTPRFGAAPAVSAASAVGRRHGPRGGGRAPTAHAGGTRGEYGRRHRAARRAPHPTAPARRSLPEATHAKAARSGTHAAALAARHAHGRETLGVRDRPTTRFSSAAGRFDRPRRATARDGVLENAQVWGRASGVCCERGWAAGWAAGRRAGAHHTCARGRGDTGRRTEFLPAAPHATDGARPTQPATSVPRYGGAIRPPLRRWWRSTRMPGSVGVEGPPNASFSSAAGSVRRPRRATARDGALKNAQVWGRASGVCCERCWAAGWAAGRRAGAHRTCGRGRGDTGRRTESCPPRPTQQVAPAQRSGGAAPHATAARSGPHAAVLPGMPRAWPDHAGAEGPPNASFSSAAGRFHEARRASARDGALKNAQVWGRASGVCCERGWAAGLAAGRRAGAHRPCARGRGDTGRRTESCPPRPTHRRRPPNAAVE